MKSKLEFLYLNEEDMIKAGVSDMSKCIASMEDVFELLDHDDYRMGGPSGNDHGIKVSFPKKTEIEGMPVDEPDRRFMAMPAYLGGKFHIFGIKTYGSNPNNSDVGLPRSILMMSLMDVETGAPLAYMSANILSAMRTGAVTGLGAKYLCGKKTNSVAIVGPGVMGRYALQAFMEVQPSINIIKIKGRGKENINRFIEYSKRKYPQIKEYVVCDSIEEACYNTDIIYFGTTNASEFEDNPSIQKSWIKKGAVIISASALLVDTDFLASTDVKLIADNYSMYEGWGRNQPFPTQRSISTLLGMAFYDSVTEGKITKDQITDIGQVMREKTLGRSNEDQIILYAVGGMPVEDVAWGYECFKNAKKNNIGSWLNLWDKPELIR